MMIYNIYIYTHIYTHIIIQNFTIFDNKWLTLLKVFKSVEAILKGTSMTETIV